MKSEEEIAQAQALSRSIARELPPRNVNTPYRVDSRASSSHGFIRFFGWFFFLIGILLALTAIGMLVQNSSTDIGLYYQGGQPPVSDADVLGNAVTIFALIDWSLRMIVSGLIVIAVGEMLKLQTERLSDGNSIS